MTRTRLASIVAAGIAALLLLAVWQIPQWLDWTRYRSTIEVLASATLGQPVTIRGPISLTLLPQPILSAAQVDVGASEVADPFIHVDALRLRIALWSLLRGQVDARELVLRGPDLRIPWPTEPGMLRPQPPNWLASFSARIENGRLIAGRLAFTGVNAALATLETGALSASGTAQFSGQDWHFTARLTSAGPDGAAGLNATLDGQGKASGLGANFSGQWAADGTLVGTLAGRGPNLGVLLPTPAVPFRADGRLTIGSGLAAYGDLVLEIGGSPASGAVALRVTPNQRLDIALSASRLDLDAWLPVLLRTSSTMAGIDLPIGVDFSAESASLSGGTLEHVRATFDLTGQALVVREATALLPGNGKLRLTGRVARSDPSRPRLEGDVHLEAPVLRTTLRWLDDAMPGTLPPRLLAQLPNGVVQRADLSAHVVAGNGEVALQSIAGTVDDAPVSGGVGFKRGDPPAFLVDLTLDRLALDPWLPERWTDLPGMPTGFDAEFRLYVQRANWAGATIDALAVDAALEAGRAQVRRMEANLRGARIVASGVFGEGGRLSAGKLNVTTENAMPLAELMPPGWRATPALWHGAAKLDVQAAGPREALVLAVRLAMADALLEAAPTVDLRSGEWISWLTLRHPGARRLVTTLGLPAQPGLGVLPSWLGDGSLSLAAHLSGRSGRLTAEKFDLTAGSLHANGNMVLDRSGSAPRVTGRIDTDAVTLALPDGTSEVPLPLGALDGWSGNLQLGIGRLTIGNAPTWRDAMVTMSVADRVLRLDQFSAKLVSGAISGSFSGDAAATPPSLSLRAKISDVIVTGPLDNTSIDVLSGRATANLQLDARGYSPVTVLATLSGRAMLSVQDGTMSGFDLFRLKLALEKSDAKSAESAVKDALHTGATAFERLEFGGSVANGNLLIDVGQLIGAAGEARASGSINLPTQALAVLVAFRPAVPTPPEVTLRLSGTIEQPVRTPELAGLARWMAELVH